MPKDKPLWPPDKQPSYSNYHNWVFLKVRQTPQAAEVVFDSKVGWIASLIISSVCITFGVGLFLATKNSLCWIITAVTAILLIGVNCHICGRETSQSPLMRFPKGSGIVELPRLGK